MGAPRSFRSSRFSRSGDAFLAASRRLAHRLPSFSEGGAAVFLLLIVCAAPLLAEDQSLGDRISSEVGRIFKERKDAVVRVEAYDNHGKLSGTGFFVDPSGTVYTLSYIVSQADEIFVVQGDRKMPAKLLVADPRSGVALIKTDYASPFIPLGSSKSLTVTSPVLTIGFPMDLGETPSFGIVGGFDRKFLDKYFVTTHIRANVPVQGGFGGAPLLDMNGDAVGILMAGIAGGAACYVLPIEAAEKIRMDYARFGAARHGWVGVKVEEQENAVDGSHVRIAELGPDTPASKSGLKAGDVLLQVGKFKVTDAEDVIDASYFLTAGDDVNFEIIRDGQKMDIAVHSAAHPVMEAEQPDTNSLPGSFRLGGNQLDVFPSTSR